MRKDITDQYDDDVDNDFVDYDDNQMLDEVDDESYVKKMISKRKQNNIKKMRRVKQGLYDYFEQKSLRENDWYYD